MGAWADKKISASVLKCHGEQLLLDRRTGAFDLDEVGADRVSAAKDVAEDVLFAENAIVGLVDGYDGPEAFLDALAGESQLTRYVDRVLAYAFLHVYARDGRNTNSSRWAGDAEQMMSKLETAAKALAGLAPHALGQSEHTGRASGGGALASTMGTYDY